jgi:hypothetical protein
MPKVCLAYITNTAYVVNKTVRYQSMACNVTEPLYIPGSGSIPLPGCTVFAGMIF